MYFLCIISKLFPLGGVAISIRKRAPLGKEYMLSGTPERFSGHKTHPVDSEKLRSSAT